VNTIIGENGAGKSNLFRAIRLLLDDSMRRSSANLQEGDFTRGIGPWRGHWIIISLEFDEISDDESIQALFLHGTGMLEGDIMKRATYNLIVRPVKSIRHELSQIPIGDTAALEELRSRIRLEDYESIFTGKSTANFADADTYTELVGDFALVTFPSELDNPTIGIKIPPVLSMPREVSFTYIQALRDVVSDFHNNRRNPLYNLLKKRSEELDKSEFDPIVSQVLNLNESIESLSDVGAVRGDVARTVNQAVGDAYAPNALSIRSDVPDTAEVLFQSLKLFLSESEDNHEMPIHELSLGGANIIYLTLKLLEFEYQTRRESIANFLLIEEPEAHVHTHIQKSLFDHIKFKNTQVIYSTHSSHVSESSKVSAVNIIGLVDGDYRAFQPWNGLTDPQIVKVERYLDAIRSNLLFARSVLLVEGDAEEILVPLLVKKVLGLSLDELGVSIVNIRSTGFENVAQLFHPDRIQKRCSILTDLDAEFFSTAIAVDDSDAEKARKRKATSSATKGLERQIKLNSFTEGNPWLETFYARNTFEVDLIAEKNSHLFKQAIEDVYTDVHTITVAASDLGSSDIAVFGQRALSMANYAGKGWFAILLGNHLTYRTGIPDYVLDGLLFAHGEFETRVLRKILAHQVAEIEVELLDTRARFDQRPPDNAAEAAFLEAYLRSREQALPQLLQLLAEYQANTERFRDMKTHLLENFSDCSINSLLAKI
tara:strand:+ start:2313 stop:4451 length:2139 start_codon:yes stop_codon:yes gene_type:complete